VPVTLSRLADSGEFGAQCVALLGECAGVALGDGDRGGGALLLLGESGGARPGLVELGVEALAPLDVSHRAARPLEALAGVGELVR
jgi:hypothetical protein